MKFTIVFLAIALLSIVVANPEPEADPAADPNALFFHDKRVQRHRKLGTIRVLRCKCRRRKLPKCTKDEDSGEEDGEYEHEHEHEQSQDGGHSCSGNSCIHTQTAPQFIPVVIPFNSGGTTVVQGANGANGSNGNNGNAPGGQTTAPSSQATTPSSQATTTSAGPTTTSAASTTTTATTTSSTTAAPTTPAAG